MNNTTIRLGINGFGRIGRMALRAVLAHNQNKEAPQIQVVAINDLIDAPYMQYLLTYDSVHGQVADVSVSEDGDCLLVQGQRIIVSSQRNPQDIQWHQWGVDVVLESTGIFIERDSASTHLAGGAPKVLVSAPSKTIPMFVMGVNDHLIQKEDTLISAASCTTNCLAPLMHCIEQFCGVEQALMCTVHASTATQKVVDGLANKDWRSGRSVFDNIIPSSTGAALALEKVIPSLKGKINGNSYRVPVSCVSMVDVVVQTARATRKQELDAFLLEQSQGKLQGILGYTQQAVVSSDFKGNRCTSIYDQSASMQLNDQFFKLVSWYDNETGYASKCIDLIVQMALR